MRTTRAAALALCAVSVWCSLQTADAAPAAAVEFVSGNAAAINTAGISRSIARGSGIEAGDTVDTGNGRVQLRFTDGAYISLQPGSRFRIDEYNYSGKLDDSERGFFSLVKGGLRTITGLIGRNNRRNYQVRVPVATIGIRGTEYTLAYDGRAYGSVGEGEIAVCNSAGCLNVPSGQAYTVASANALPELSTLRSFLAPPPLPPIVEPVFLVNNDIVMLNDPIHCSGRPSPCAVPRSLIGLGSNTPTSGPTGDQPVTETLGLVTTAAMFSTRESMTNVRSADVTTQGGRLLSWSESGGTVTTGTTAIVDSGNLGQIAWGRLANGTLGGNSSLSSGQTLSGADSLHFIFARPTPDVFVQAAAHLVYTQLVGGTSPTSQAGVGTLTGAFVDINASLGTANATVSLITADQIALAFNHAGTLSGSFFGGSSGNGSGAGCTPGCTGNFSGVIAGPQGQYAGFAYDIEGSAIPGGVRGTAILRR